MLCKKCVLPEIKSSIVLDHDGVCSLCRQNSSDAFPHKQRIVESELVKIFDKFRGKSKYDCLLMCSGGKDSTASLYYVRKRYGLNPLVFTFDNGFEQKAALDNVEKAVNVLGVDWLYMKSDFMKKMYSDAVRHKANFPFCTLCSLWYMQLTYGIAESYNLPLIVAGWTIGQMVKSDKYVRNEGAGFDVLCKGIGPFIDRMRQAYPEYAQFPRNMEEVKKKYKIAKKAVIVSPHWFLPYDNDEYVAVIKEELGWRPLDFSYPRGSANCTLNVVSSYMSLRYCGFTHFHVEMSKLIRCGLMTRDEALQKLKLDINDDKTASVMQEVLARLGCQDVAL
ncbi:MAG: hypothetical protein PHC37_06495 [Candidatus Omnitrophica bacterium]|jgi:tRNA(Ile)-lysidine synthase TilS/MesJ|nr:hypothetical protein [Candidatus Omnitrophota bacterium]MDD5691320.1 hypothetical protein [Candidatus Omnitrophota bacterium]